MMRLRRASVITALSLLASAATAYAECAWVLWLETSIAGRGKTPGQLETSTQWEPTGHATKA